MSMDAEGKRHLQPRAELTTYLDSPAAALYPIHDTLEYPEAYDDEKCYSRGMLAILREKGDDLPSNSCCFCYIEPVSLSDI